MTTTAGAATTPPRQQQRQTSWFCLDMFDILGRNQVELYSTKNRTYAQQNSAKHNHQARRRRDRVSSLAAAAFS
jgi:hypothetical protein